MDESAHRPTPQHQNVVSFNDAQLADVQMGQVGHTIINNYYGDEQQRAAAQRAAASFADGLGALRRLVDTSPDIRGTVAVFYERLGAARARVHRLIALKSVHDALHGLQYKDLPSLIRELRHFPEDELTHDSIAVAVDELRAVADVAQAQVDGGELEPEVIPWCPQLRKLADEIAAGLAAGEKLAIDRAARRARSIVGLNLTRLNNQLSGLADTLRPHDMAQPLQGLSERLADLAVDPADLERVTSGVGGLLELHTQLSGLVKVHNDWQTLDDELRRVESSLRVDASELEWSWADLRVRIDALCAGPESWAANIRTQRDQVDQALGAAMLERLAQRFDRLQQGIGRQFFQIDLRLKEHCDRLNRFRDPLNDLDFALAS